MLANRMRILAGWAASLALVSLAVGCGGGNPPPAPMTPFAIVSLMTLDGSGALTNDVTVSRNGVIFRNVDPGAYNISEDCTGNMSINIAEPPFLLTFDLVVADKGNEFYAIATTPSVVTFGGKRLH